MIHTPVSTLKNKTHGCGSKVESVKAAMGKRSGRQLEWKYSLNVSSQNAVFSVLERRSSALAERAEMAAYAAQNIAAFKAAANLK